MGFVLISIAVCAYVFVFYACRNYDAALRAHRNVSYPLWIIAATCAATFGTIGLVRILDIGSMDFISISVLVFLFIIVPTLAGAFGAAAGTLLGNRARKMKSD